MRVFLQETSRNILLCGPRYRQEYQGWYGPSSNPYSEQVRKHPHKGTTA